MNRIHNRLYGLLLCLYSFTTACTPPGADPTPCGALNDRLAGTWIRTLGTTGQLPDEFSLVALGGTGGIYSEPSFGKLEYSLSVDCDAILLIDAAGELYRTWHIDLDQDSLDVEGPWSSTSSYYRENNCQIAVALLRGGPEALNSGTNSPQLDAMAMAFESAYPGVIHTNVIASNDDWAAQRDEAEAWFMAIDASSTQDVERVLIGHSNGGDTVRRSGALSVSMRFMLDPVDRDIAQFGFPLFCDWTQRELSYPAPPDLVANFQREYSLSAAEIQACDVMNMGSGCGTPAQFSTCIAGYNVLPIGSSLNIVLPGTNHGSVVSAAIPLILSEIESLIP